MCFFDPRVEFAIGSIGLRRRLGVSHEPGNTPSVDICSAADRVLPDLVALTMQLGNSCVMDVMKIGHLSVLSVAEQTFDTTNGCALKIF